MTQGLGLLAWLIVVHCCVIERELKTELVNNYFLYKLQVKHRQGRLLMLGITHYYYYYSIT